MERTVLNPNTEGTNHSSLVLVVDDSKEIRDLVAYFMKILGCTSVVAANGLEAIKLLEDGVKPDLILLDLMMPVMDGWQTDHELATHPNLANIPTVIVSAFPERAKELERPHEVIRKPMTLNSLKEIVFKYCSCAKPKRGSLH
jgi:CheY-like chemotaxis protein